MVDKYYELTDIMDMLHLTRRTLYNYIKEGKLKAFKVGREWRVTETDVIAFLKGCGDTTSKEEALLP